MGSIIIIIIIIIIIKVTIFKTSVINHIYKIKIVIALKENKSKY